MASFASFCFGPQDSALWLRDVSVLKHKPWALLITSHRMQCAFKGCGATATGLLSQSEHSSALPLWVLLLKSHQSSFWCNNTAPWVWRSFGLVDSVIFLFACLAMLTTMSSKQKMLVFKELNWIVGKKVYPLGHEDLDENNTSFLRTVHIHL